MLHCYIAEILEVMCFIEFKQNMQIAGNHDKASRQSPYQGLENQKIGILQRAMNYLHSWVKVVCSQ